VKSIPQKGISLKTYSFAKSKKNLTEVLTDKNLASLGDAYINFAYSLALSNRCGEPVGTKMKGSVLAEALRKAGLRKHLPSRMDQHSLADAAEALLVYAWLNKSITLVETVEELSAKENAVDNLCELLTKVARKVKFFS
jgi:hypothetical protein